MKTVITIVLMLVCVTILGCQSSSPRGGVPNSEGFSIAVPTFSTEVKQGQSQTIIISVKRDEYFKQNVELEIEAPKGISVEPDEISLLANDKPDVQLLISVAKDAAIGEYKISVKGTPKTGTPTSMEFNVTVVAP